MDTWERLADFSGEAGGGDWKRLAREHIWVYAQALGTDNSVLNSQGEGRAWGVRGQIRRNEGHL